jgi:hypothetical protein
MDEIDPAGEELIKIICSYLSGALEEALEEVEEKELFSNDVDSMEIAQKHLRKRLSYIQEEGWLEDEEVSS